MCRRVKCQDCGRPTFAGCGAHVEQVLGDVPPTERCKCREDRSRAGGRSGAPPPTLAWLQKLFAK